MEADRNSDMDENDVEDTRGCTSHFTSESHGTNKVKSIFKKRLSRSSSLCNSNGSAKISSFIQFFREATKMNWELKLTLPSDKSWRMKNYFKLLTKQREKKILLHSMPSQESDVSSNWDPALLAPPELKRAKFSGSSSISSEGSIPTCPSLDITWTSLDIAKAGIILEANSSANVSFRDEEEMRRVFTLLYDVFRYKHILNEALLETRFFQKYQEHGKKPTLVWLLFYDLYKRRFLPREHADTAVSADLFYQIGLTFIEKDLWESKVKLAASLARNRIKNNALRLNQLLPNHLRDERLISAEDSPMTGWINTFRMCKKDVCDKIENFGLKLQSKHETILTKNDFRFDHLCPKLVLCHPIQRAELAQSELLKNHAVVLQDRAFCIGPAIIAKILSEVPLRGTVAQSHVNSPRTTAYLANILADNDRLDKMIVFGAGDKLLEYQTYLHDLGVTNCEIYAQKFTEIHPEAAVLENLVAVFATPPNSCTGVTDPVDLICSRGGDMCMLKALTQSGMMEDSCTFLEEQKGTLEYCMSLPQVQIVLYETHSMAPEENQQMVENTINKMNEYAKEKHEEDHRIMLEQEAAEEKQKQPIGIPGMSREKEKEADPQETAPVPKEVVVPPCDLFELAPLPDLCSHGMDCLTEEGCYIARIQRKEIISLDAKYMIKIAEARGLFGNDVYQKKSTTARGKKRDDPGHQRCGSGKIKTRRVKVEIERLTAPTQSSMHRTRKGESFVSGFADCPRHHFHTLESTNKVEVFSARSVGDTIRRKSRTKKCQDESVRRLSRPNRRWSTSPSDLLVRSEVRPSFWRYATAKSVEDLIRALRKKRRTKRNFQLDDYFILENQKIVQRQKTKQNLTEEDGIPGLQINFFGKKFIYPFRKPYIDNKVGNTSVFDDYTEKVLLVVDGDDQIPRYEVDKSIQIISNESGNESKKSASTIASDTTFVDGENFLLLRQCFQDTVDVFDNINRAVEEAEESIMKPYTLETQSLPIHPVPQRRRERNLKPKRDQRKFLKYIQKNAKIKEIGSGVNNQKRKDIVLQEKYLPGQLSTVEDKIFIKSLQSKLEMLHGDYPTAHWSKKKEQISASRLCAKKET